MWRNSDIGCNANDSGIQGNETNCDVRDRKHVTRDMVTPHAFPSISQRHFRVYDVVKNIQTILLRYRV